MGDMPHQCRPDFVAHAFAGASRRGLLENESESVERFISRCEHDLSRRATWPLALARLLELLENDLIVTRFLDAHEGI